MPITIDIQARTEQAKTEFAGLGKVVERTQKLLAGMGGGRSGAASNIAQMTKGTQSLAKSADQANQRYQLLSRTLADVNRQIRQMEAGGSVALANRAQYQLLTRQQQQLQRQQQTWQTIAANRQAMAQPGPNAPRGAGGFLGLVRGVGGGVLGRATGGFGSSAASSVLGAGGVGAIEEALGPVLGTIALAVVGAGVKGFSAALKQDESLVKFLPRMFPAQMAGVVPSVMATRMGAVGRRYAFNREESIAAFAATSEGGSPFRSKRLNRDADAAMAYARMFGMDPGGAGTVLASAQRAGAFKAGDAKRFAGMLAAEIKRTGLGPRFDEVQQATLMLLNRQTQELGGARPGPIMALQTMLDKTGIPGVTGMNGASFITRLQDSITHPNGEAAQALNFQVARKMGARSYYDIMRIQEEGISNPKFLQTLFGLVERSQPNQHLQDLALQGYSPNALTLPLLARLRRGAPGGSLARMTSTGMAAAEKLLSHGGGLLDKGAKTTTEAFPSLQIKSAEIMIHEATLAIGQPILNKVAGLAHGATGTAAALAGSGSTAARADAVAAAASAALGLKPGSDGDKAVHGAAAAAVKAAGLWKAYRAGGSVNGLVSRYVDDPIAAAMKRLFGAVDPNPTGAKWHSWMRPGVHFSGMPGAVRDSLSGALGAMTGAGLHPTVTSAVRSYREQQGAYWRYIHGISPYPAARPGHSRHETGLAVDISAPAAERARINAFMAAHGFAHDVPGDPVHYDYRRPLHIQVEVNHPAFKAYVKQTNHELQHDATRAQPNTRAHR